MSVLPAFQPTRAQRRFFDCVQQSPEIRSLEQICQAAGVHRSSYYRWCADPAFRQWLTASWSTTVFMDGWQLLNFLRATHQHNEQWFRMLFNLIFSPKGQAALGAWSGLAAQNVASPALQTQPLAPQNATVAGASVAPSASAPPKPAPRVNPAVAIGELQSTLAALRRFAPPNAAIAPAAPPSGGENRAAGARQP